MRLFSIIVVLLFALPANAQIIPLDTIWATSMPGTKNIMELDAKEPTLDEGASEYIKHHQMLFGTPLRRILYYLGYNAPKDRAMPTRAIVIEGKVDQRMVERVDAMFWTSAWHGVGLWQDKMPVNRDLTLVFYSYGPKGLPPKIMSVEKEGRIVEVKYQLRSDRDSGRVQNARYYSPIRIALIPIGKFKAVEDGKVISETVDVKITELPAVYSDGKPIEGKVSSDHVSSSMSFEVR